jgi:hypothetical protein
MGTIFKNVLLEDDTGGRCAALTDISGGASPSPTDEIKIIIFVPLNTKKLPFSRELLLYYF